MNTFTLSEEIYILNNKLDQIAESFDSEEENIREVYSLYQIKLDVENLFDKHQNYNFKPTEMTDLTNLCRRLNEEPKIQKGWEILNMKLPAKQYDKNNYVSYSKINSEEMIVGSTYDSLTGKSVQSMEYINHKMTHFDNLLQTSRPHLKLPKMKQRLNLSIDEYIQNEQSISEMSDIDTSITSSKCGLEEDNELKKSSFNYQIEDLIRKLKSAYEDHEIDKAYKLLGMIEDIKTNKANMRIEESINTKLEQNSVLFTDVENDYKMVECVLKELNDDTDYSIDVGKRGVITKCKSLSGGKTALKIEMTLDISLINILSLLHKTDNYMNWAPFCKESREIKKISKAAYLAWLKWSLPPPISNREAYVIGKGFNRLEENGTFLLTMNTIDENKHIQQRHKIDIPAKSSLVRMSIPYTGIELKPINKDVTEVRVAMMIDSKMKMIPNSVISWMIRKGASHLKKVLLKAANKNDMSSKEKMKGDSEFYKWLNYVINKYHHNQHKNNSP